MDTSLQDIKKRWFEGSKKCTLVVLTQMLLLMVCCKNEKSTEAMNIFYSMIRKGVKPIATTYGILLHGYAAKGALC
jgi:pentatricopeptide repeat protein